MRRSLKFRIAAIAFVVQAAVLSLVLSLTLPQALSSADQRLQAIENQTLKLLAHSARTPLLTEDFSDFEALLYPLRHDPMVDRILLTDDRGIIVASSEDRLIGKSLRELTADDQHHWREAEVHNTAGHLGLIAVRFSDAELHAARQAIWQRGLLIAGIGAALALLVGWLIGLLMSRRIERLSDTAQALAEGDLSRRIELPGNDEISQLGQAINQMAESIEHDIAAREQAQQDLLASEQRYALAAQGVNDGLWDWDLGSNQIYLSPRAKQMLGLPKSADMSHADDLFARLDPNDRQAVRKALRQHLQGDSPQFQVECRVLHTGGQARWMLYRGVAVRDEQGRAVRMAGSQTDISAQKRIEQTLRHNATHDELTQLPNRTLLGDRLERMTAHAARHPEYGYAVTFLDLDHFKKINDSLGHAAGDRLLQEVAKRVSWQLRPSDTIARTGGDEFVILMDDIRDAADAVQVVERIQGAFAQPFELDGQPINIGCSFGIALHRPEAGEGEDLLRDADTALYQAKQQGRNSYQIFDQAMHAQVTHDLQIENELRSALAGQQLALQYQPVVDLRSGLLVGYEALVRWQHPGRGLLPPAEFLPVAEESGLILQIGDWVLNNACAQIARWPVQQQRPLHVSINLSARQLVEGLPEQLQAILQRSGTRPEQVCLELTETSLLRDVDKASEILRRLRAIGLRIALDDFGTGYSSLAYLQRLPFDTLKIDRSFVQTLDRPGGQRGLVAAMIDIADNLGLQVIAEGLETPAQLDALRELNCPLAQGFLMSRPVDAQQAWALYEKPATLKALLRVTDKDQKA